jgi:hypothetical protein
VTYQLLDDSLDERSEGQVSIGLFSVIDILCELGNTLSVSLALKDIAILLQDSLELLVVGNDTVVNDGELAGSVRSVRMRVHR